MGMKLLGIMSALLWLGAALGGGVEALGKLAGTKDARPVSGSVLRPGWLDEPMFHVAAFATLADEVSATGCGGPEGAASPDDLSGFADVSAAIVAPARAVNFGAGFGETASALFARLHPERGPPLPASRA